MYNEEKEKTRRETEARGMQLRTAIIDALLEIKPCPSIKLSTSADALSLYGQYNGQTVHAEISAERNGTVGYFRGYTGKLRFRIDGSNYRSTNTREPKAGFDPKVLAAKILEVAAQKTANEEAILRAREAQDIAEAEVERINALNGVEKYHGDAYLFEKYGSIRLDVGKRLTSAQAERVLAAVLAALKE